MKDALAHLPEILKCIREGKGTVTMLDFDGVLARIAKTPDEAFIEPSTKTILERYAPHTPIAIITGRSLADIIRLVGLDRLAYAGNHGMEWVIGKKTDSVKPSESMIEALADSQRAVRSLMAKYPGMHVEDKGLTYSVHFRLVDRTLLDALRRDMEAATRPMVSAGDLHLSEGNLVFEVTPRLGWNKGRCARLMCGHIQAQTSTVVPVFIGDDVTDETAFKEFASDGITVRVGYKEGSAAKYFLKDREAVDGFLESILAESIIA